MILSRHSNLPRIDGVIFIDMWVPRPDIGDVTDAWYRTVVQHIDSDPGLYPKHFVNACYMNKIDPMDRSISNTLAQYQPGSVVIENIERYCQGLNQTSEIIRQLLNHRHSIFLLDATDFLEHWKNHLFQLPCNWLVVGQSWQICLHTRPMGLNRLQQLSQQTPLRFFMCEWSGFTEDHTVLTAQHFENDHLPWAEIPGFGYELLP
jgi:hypothetical protein